MSNLVPFDRHDLVSIVMPSFNSATTIGSAIASVQAQSYDKWEILVADDGSTDTTREIVSGIARADPRILIEHLCANSGAAYARNSAIRRARGRFVAFLDADDIWLPDKLSRQMAQIRQTSAPFVYSGYFRDNGSSRRRVAVPDTVSYAQLLRGNVIGCLTALYDTQQLGKRYMPDIPMRHDYALWLSILRDVPLAYGLAEPLAVYHVHAGSLSYGALRGARGTWRMYRDVMRFGPATSVYFLARHYANRLNSLR